jgi:hypothetical protein
MFSPAAIGLAPILAKNGFRSQPIQTLCQTLYSNLGAAPIFPEWVG